MQNKKVVFVIVEGPSDMTAIGAILSNLYKGKKVHVEITHGDILTHGYTNSGIILSKIQSLVARYMRNYGIKKKDISEILHIVDTDGVFIDKTMIKEDLNIEDVVYDSNCIKTNNVKLIENRNIQKSSSLRKLMATYYVYTDIPYSIYYVSCNMDLVIANKYNLSDLDKATEAYIFANKYKNNIDGFIKFVNDPSLVLSKDYRES